jgi:hypothetical protein
MRAAQDVAAVAGAVKVGGRFFIGIDRQSFRIYRGHVGPLDARRRLPEVESSSSAISARGGAQRAGRRAGHLGAGRRARAARTRRGTCSPSIGNRRRRAPVVIERARSRSLSSGVLGGRRGLAARGRAADRALRGARGQDGAWSPRRVDARWIAGPHGLVSDALSAEGELPRPGPSARPSGSTTTNRADDRARCRSARWPLAPPLLGLTKQHIS